MSKPIDPQRIKKCEEALTQVGLLPAKKLAEYMAVLMEINETTNLTGAKTEYDLALKHIADAYFAWKAMDGLKYPIYDVGSGGGLPGIVFSILSPASEVTLVERRTKKADCLKSIVDALGFSERVSVIGKAFEEIKEVDSDTEMWCRGFLPGKKLAEYLSKNFDSNSLPRVVLMKGPSWSSEKLEIASMKRLDVEWKDRLLSSVEVHYSLPHGAGERTLVLV